MSAAEFGRWCEYFNKYGRFTPVRMYDYAPALLAAKIDHALGGKSQVRDYIHYGKPKEEEMGEDNPYAILRELWGVNRG